MDIVKLLLRHGAHVNVRDEDGTTALQLASGPCRKMIELILMTHETLFVKPNPSSISECQTAKIADRKSVV